MPGIRDCMGKLTFAAALAACAVIAIASAEAAVVVVSTTIQAAVNKASQATSYSSRPALTGKRCEC